MREKRTQGFRELKCPDASPKLPPLPHPGQQASGPLFWTGVGSLRLEGGQVILTWYREGPQARAKGSDSRVRPTVSRPLGAASVAHRESRSHSRAWARTAPAPTCRSTWRRPRLSRHFRYNAEVPPLALGICPNPCRQPLSLSLSVPSLSEPGKRTSVGGRSLLLWKKRKRKERSKHAGGPRPRPRHHLGEGRALPGFLSGTLGTT